MQSVGQGLEQAGRDACLNNILDQLRSPERITSNERDNLGSDVSDFRDLVFKFSQAAECHHPVGYYHYALRSSIAGGTKSANTDRHRSLFRLMVCPNQQFFSPTM